MRYLRWLRRQVSSIRHDRVLICNCPKVKISFSMMQPNLKQTSTYSRLKVTELAWAADIDLYVVSTHSHPKAAERAKEGLYDLFKVSTHSRPKAAELMSCNAWDIF